MGTVIYSASPVQAFLGSLGTIVLLIVFGIAGIAIAAFRRKQTRASRILTGLLGAFLLVTSCILAVITLVSYTSGSKSVTLRLSNKTIATDNCGDNGETCSRYVLEAETSTRAYDFDVPQNVYDKAQVNNCYQISYFQNGGLFGSAAGADASYQQIDNITEIAESTACQ